LTTVSDIPVSVKSRIGVDDMESYEQLSNFVTQIENAGCENFVIHARKAWLKGLSPKENRTVPPLN
jgi:tRNA-dihydrouridine synthase A